MVRFLEMVNEQLKDTVKRMANSLGQELSAVDNLLIELRIRPSSDLEEMASDLEAIQDSMTDLIDYGTISLVAKRLLKQMRYKLAQYTTPICVSCGESPARYVNDGWYCERCVKKYG